MNTLQIIQALHRIMDAQDLHFSDDYQYPLISREIIQKIREDNNTPVIIDITSEDIWKLFHLSNISESNIKCDDLFTINNHPILLIFNQ